MKEEIRTMIHQLDLAADHLEDTLLLETAAAVRETLLDLTEENAEGLPHREWLSALNRLWNVPGGPDEKEKILHVLRVLTEPLTRFAKEALPEDTAGIRGACRAQGNRIRFVRALEPFLDTLRDRLPDTERQEEAERMIQIRRLASEGFDHLLALYQQKAAEDGGTARHRELDWLEQFETEEKEQQERLVLTDRIKACRAVLAGREKKFQEIFETRRINVPGSGLQRCNPEERRKISVQHDTEAEE